MDQNPDIAAALAEVGPRLKRLRAQRGVTLASLAGAVLNAPDARETDMAKTRGTGLLMVWADIDPQYEAEYHRWYD